MEYALMSDEERFRASLTSAHDTLANTVNTVAEFQNCVCHWESANLKRASLLVGPYFELRQVVLNFPLIALPLREIFGELSGGLLTSAEAITPIEEQREFYTQMVWINATVWQTLKLGDVCKSPPPFPAMHPNKDAIRKWQEATKQSDPEWMADRIQKHYPSMRIHLLRMPSIDSHEVFRQLFCGNDKAVSLWMSMIAARGFLGGTGAKTKSEKPVFKSRNPERDAEVIRLTNETELSSEQIAIQICRNPKWEKTKEGNEFSGGAVRAIQKRARDAGLITKTTDF
jgi:hypothetical protein